MANLVINLKGEVQTFALMTESEHVIAVIEAPEGVDILPKVLQAVKEEFASEQVLFRYFGNTAETTIHLKVIDNGTAYDKAFYLLKTIKY